MADPFTNFGFKTPSYGGGGFPAAKKANVQRRQEFGASQAAFAAGMPKVQSPFALQQTSATQGVQFQGAQINEMESFRKNILPNCDLNRPRHNGFSVSA